MRYARRVLWLVLTFPVAVGVLFLVWRTVARAFGFEGYLPVVRTARVSVGRARVARPIAAVIAFGVLYLVAWLLFAVSASLRGTYVPTRAVHVVPGGAAEQAGIQDGDEFLSIDGKTVEGFDDIRALVRFAERPTIDVRVRRGGEERSFIVAPRIDDGTPRIGVQAEVERRPVAFVDALHGSVTTPVLAMREGIRRLTSKRSPLEGVIELVREAETAPPSVAIALSNNVAIALSHLLCTVCPLVLLLLSIFGWRMAPRPNASAPPGPLHEQGSQSSTLEERDP